MRSINLLLCAGVPPILDPRVCSKFQWIDMHTCCRLLCNGRRDVLLDACAAQVLLAIANGAWLLRPEWVSASLEAGQWLPEAPFEAQVRACSARSPGTRLAKGRAWW